MSETVKEPTNRAVTPCDGSCGCPEVARLREKHKALHRAQQKAEGALLRQQGRMVTPWASDERKAEAADRDEIGTTIDRTELGRLTSQLSRLTSDEFINGLAEKIADPLTENYPNEHVPWSVASSHRHAQKIARERIASIIKSAINEEGK